MIETIGDEFFEITEDNNIIQPNNVFNLDMIPLYSGSTVFVAKRDLQGIFTPKYNIYAGRLAEKVFGKEFLMKQIRDEIKSCENNSKKPQIELDPVKLFSIISNLNLFYFVFIFFY